MIGEQKQYSSDSNSRLYRDCRYWQSRHKDNLFNSIMGFLFSVQIPAKFIALILRIVIIIISLYHEDSFYAPIMGAHGIQRPEEREL